MIFAWAIAGALALAPEPAEPAPARSGPAAASPGRLVFAADYAGAVTVVDARGQAVAQVSLGHRVTVELPPGRYTLVDAEGEEETEEEESGGAEASSDQPMQDAEDESGGAAPTEEEA